MSKDLVTFVVSIVVDSNESEGVLENFNNNIASNGLHIVNNEGKKLVAECVGSKVTEILSYSDELDEIVLYKNDSDINYQYSNSIRSEDDLIQIESMGLYTIVLIPRLSYLYNSKKKTRIDLGEDVISLDQVRLYLEENHFNYKVLRKIT